MECHRDCGAAGPDSSRRVKLTHYRLVEDFGRPPAGIDRHETVGYNFTFTVFKAVVGIEQMKKLPARAEWKQAIFARYRERLSDAAGVSFLATDFAEVTPWYIDILVEAGRLDPLAAFLKGHGIGTRPFFRRSIRSRHSPRAAALSPIA